MTGGVPAYLAVAGGKWVVGAIVDQNAGPLLARLRRDVQFDGIFRHDIIASYHIALLICILLITGWHIVLLIVTVAAAAVDGPARVGRRLVRQLIILAARSALLAAARQLNQVVIGLDNYLGVDTMAVELQLVAGRFHGLAGHVRLASICLVFVTISLCAAVNFPVTICGRLRTAVSS